jgi:3-phenylpropionate/trans-cinnamate dioxygenase ferredoxin subunit
MLHGKEGVDGSSPSEGFDRSPGHEQACSSRRGGIGQSATARGGQAVGVFNVEGKFYAVLNRCPHMGGELAKGDVIGLVESDRPGDVRLDKSKKFIACPLHGWEYDLETGESWCDPGRTRARPVPVRVSRGDVVNQDLGVGASAVSAQFVDPATHRTKGPYTADIFPVSVEEDYVVVSLRHPRPRPERGVRNVRPRTPRSRGRP